MNERGRNRLLFLFVLRLMAQAGPKRLTADQLANELGRAAANTELTLLNNINQMREYLSRRLDEMSSRIDSIPERTVAALTSSFEIRPKAAVAFDEGLIAEKLARSSAALLSWEQETGGRWIERGEPGIRSVPYPAPVRNDALQIFFCNSVDPLLSVDPHGICRHFVVVPRVVQNGVLESVRPTPGG